MSDTTANTKKSLWEKMAVILPLVAVCGTWWAIHENDKNANQNRIQQQIVSQGVVMSACMKEFFQIRRETIDKWSATNSALVQDTYAEQMYGLHFEEYHLFQRNLIPPHVYAVWLKYLKDDTLRTNTSKLPKLDFRSYLNKDSYSSFNNFYASVLDSDSSAKINDLVNKELDSAAKNLGIVPLPDY